MMDKSIQKYDQNILNLIFTIRGKQVMIDKHLADLYGIETKYLNRAVKRNPERFPESFMFQLTKDEYDGLRFQIGTSDKAEALRFQNGTSSSHGGRRYLPYVFTEQGISMLSAVLRSPVAIEGELVEVKKQMQGYMKELGL